MPPRQCYAPNATAAGLWYLDRPLYPDESGAVAVAVGVVAAYRLAHPIDIIVVNVHAGPNFEWAPAADREAFLRSLSDAGADLVWGTSSHHLQRMERRVLPPASTMRGGDGGGESDGAPPRRRSDDDDAVAGGGRPIIFGLGDLLFRFRPGVDEPETCEEGMAPCEQFRPALSFVYEFIFDLPMTAPATPATPTTPKTPAGGAAVGAAPAAARTTGAALTGIRAHPTAHGALQVQPAAGKDRAWLVRTFRRLSEPFGFSMREDTAEDGSRGLWVVPC